MTQRQTKIGKEFLKYLAEKGDANTDDQFLYLSQEKGFDSIEDQVQIGVVRSHLLRLKLIEPVGSSDHLLTLTSAGKSANKIGLEQWLEETDNNNNTPKTSKKIISFKSKKSIVLNTLYERRFDGNLHDIEDLVDTSGYTEAYQIGKALQDEGLINAVISKDSVDVQITAYGIEFLEEAEEHDELEYAPQDRFNENEIEVMKTKIDELTERIRAMEVGQQITYDDVMVEFQEMKALLTVLGKKNWIEILKGKMADAGLGTLTGKMADILIETTKQSNLLGN